MATLRKKSLENAHWGYIFSIPFVIAFVLFNLYPTIYTAVLGFTDCKGLGNTSWTLLEDPLQNFRLILNNQSFTTSLKNTVVIWALNFTPQLLVAMVLAAWFTARRVTVKGQGIFKIIFYMPNIITAATIAILFYSLFNDPVSPMNDLLMKLHVIDEPYKFFTNKTAAKLIVAFIQFWIWYGYTMIILISGILGISPDIYEAADIDGANGFQIFFRITVPNLKTVLLYTLVTSMIGGLNMFDIPKLFLGGGPDNATLTTSVFIYNQAFQGSFMYNRAAAASMILFAMIAVLSAIIFYLMRDKEEIAHEKERKAHLKAQKAAARKRGY